MDKETEDIMTDMFGKEGKKKVKRAYKKDAGDLLIEEIKQKVEDDFRDIENTVKSYLPQLGLIKDEDAEAVIMCNEAFGTSAKERLLLGTLIKYLGKYDKEIRIIPMKGEKDESND